MRLSTYKFCLLPNRPKTKFCILGGIRCMFHKLKSVSDNQYTAKCLEIFQDGQILPLTGPSALSVLLSPLSTLLSDSSSSVKIFSASSSDFTTLHLFTKPSDEIEIRLISKGLWLRVWSFIHKLLYWCVSNPVPISFFILPFDRPHWIGVFYICRTSK